MPRHLVLVPMLASGQKGEGRSLLRAAGACDDADALAAFCRKLGFLD